MRDSMNEPTPDRAGTAMSDTVADAWAASIQGVILPGTGGREPVKRGRVSFRDLQKKSRT